MRPGCVLLRPPLRGAARCHHALIVVEDEMACVLAVFSSALRCAARRGVTALMGSSSAWRIAARTNCPTFCHMSLRKVTETTSLQSQFTTPISKSEFQYSPSKLSPETAAGGAVHSGRELFSLFF